MTIERTDTIATGTPTSTPVQSLRDSLFVLLSDANDGAWDGATITLQKLVAGTWIDLPDGLWTANTAETVDAPAGGQYRLNGTSIGASTSIIAHVTG